VTCHDELVTEALVVPEDEPRADDDRSERSGWLRRLLVAGEGGRRGSWALGLGAFGAAAFLASLLLDWQMITFTGSADGTGPFDGSVTSGTVGSGVGDLTSFGSIYLFGMVALLAFAGAAVSRAEVAARHRFAVVGGAVGLLAVLIGFSTRLTEEAFGFPANFQMMYGNPNYSMAVGPGLFAGFVAVVSTTAAIWLAAHADAEAPRARFTRRRVAAGRTVPAAPGVAPDVVGPAALPEYQRRHNDGPIDLTVTPG
jgi:hypothetical protein